MAGCWPTYSLPQPIINWLICNPNWLMRDLVKIFFKNFFFSIWYVIWFLLLQWSYFTVITKKNIDKVTNFQKKNWVRLGMILTRYITHCLTRFDPSNFGLWWVLTRLLSIHPNLTQLAQLPPLSEMRLWKKQGKSNKIIIFTWETIWCLCSYLLLFWVLPRSSLTEI